MENMKGMECPYKSILCQEGYCSGCNIWVQRQRTKCVKYGTSCFPESDDSCVGCADHLAYLLTDLANKIVHLNRLEKELQGQKRNPDKDPVGMADELKHPELAELNRKFHEIVGGL